MNNINRGKVFYFKMTLLLFYFAHALNNAYIIPFLTTLGYNAFERAVIFAIVAIVAIIGQMIMGFLCDKLRIIKKILIINSVIHAIVTYLLYSTTNNIFFLHIILVGLVGGYLKIIQGLLDSWVLESGENYKSSYGSVRAFGSIGWAIGAPVGGYIIQYFGYKYIGIGFTIITIISLLFSLSIPEVKKVNTETKITFHDFQLLLKNYNYILLVTAFLFAFIVGNSTSYIIIDKLVILGATEFQISLQWCLQSIFEMPLFLVGRFLIKKISSRKIIIFALIMYFIRYILYAFAVSVNQMILLACMSIVTYPLIIITSKELIDYESPLHLKSSGQQLALAIYSGGSILIAPIISNILLGCLGVNIALIIIAFMAIISLLIILVYIKRVKHN